MSDRVLLEPHAHTKDVSPCGWLSSQELVRALGEAGYGAVVVTDHYIPGERESASAREAFLAGIQGAKKTAENRGMVVLPGMEIRFAGKIEDFLVYGMTEEDILGLPDDVCEKGVRAFHELARTNGWLVYQAHPFRPKMLPADPSEIDGMEIFNGNPRHDSRNRLAASFATLHSIRTIAGSDLHRPGDAGLAGLVAPRDALTPKGFAAWLRATPHPRVHYQEAPRDGIRYVVGAIPGESMVAALYQDAGWTAYLDDIKQSMAGIRCSLRIVTAWDDTALIGMARAIGDGQTILYVQDILVLGGHQRRGIGRALMKRLLEPFRDVRQVVLIANETASTNAFYKSLGFENVNRYQCAAYMRAR